MTAMTISDTERREVARRLRGIDAERLDRVYGMDGEGGECSDPDMAKAGRNLMLGAIAEAVGLHYAPYYFDAAPLRDRLADLIEPPTQCPYYRSDRHYCSIHDVPAIDRDALLARGEGGERVMTEYVTDWQEHYRLKRERVVRCRDCKHSWNDGRTCGFFSDFDDGHIIPASVYPDGFCAWGEPRLERGGMETPTERQLALISDMQDELGVRFGGSTKAEASEWIDGHIDAYRLATADPVMIEHGYF